MSIPNARGRKAATAAFFATWAVCEAIALAALRWIEPVGDELRSHGVSLGLKLNTEWYWPIPVYAENAPTIWITVVIVSIAYLLWRGWGAPNRAEGVMLGIVAGALASNLLGRMGDGVVDYMVVHWGGEAAQVVNVPDLLIVITVIAYGVVRSRRDEQNLSDVIAVVAIAKRIRRWRREPERRGNGESTARPDHKPRRAAGSPHEAPVRGTKELASHP